MAPKKSDTEAAADNAAPSGELGAGEVFVRVNPTLWRLNFVEVGDRTFGHDEPYVAVPEREYESELTKHTTTIVDNEGEEHDLQLLVRA
jgi:hypothetical protein